MRQELDFDAGWMVQRGELSTPIPRNGSKTGALGGASDLTLAEGADPLAVGAERPPGVESHAPAGGDLGQRGEPGIFSGVGHDDRLVLHPAKSL